LGESFFIDALKLILKKDKASLTEILKIINGPDLPTGGEIILDSNEKKQIYKNGKGSFNINAKYEIEELKNGLYQIIIIEIPYQVNKVKIPIVIIENNPASNDCFILPILQISYYFFQSIER